MAVLDPIHDGPSVCLLPAIHNEQSDRGDSLVDFWLYIDLHNVSRIFPTG